MQHFSFISLSKFELNFRVWSSCQRLLGFCLVAEDGTQSGRNLGCFPRDAKGMRWTTHYLGRWVAVEVHSVPCTAQTDHLNSYWYCQFAKTMFADIRAFSCYAHMSIDWSCCIHRILISCPLHSGLSRLPVSWSPKAVFACFVKSCNG